MEWLRAAHPTRSHVEIHIDGHDQDTYENDNAYHSKQPIHDHLLGRRRAVTQG
jgi:hypothetical protein